MKVQIWSDVMCPFCYIAKNNFEKAIEQLPFANDIQVEWKSYQLDPELKENSGSKTFGQYLMERKGFSAPQTKQFLQQLTDMGQNSGVNFNHDRTFVANTFPAHKLLHLAKKAGKDNEMEELLFRALFEDGKNIADTELLVSLAEQLGIEREMAKDVLSSDKFEYEVKQDFMEARNMGISGVPFFVLNDKYSVSGAQPVEAFVSALTQTYKETVKPLENLGGNDKSCSADGCSL
ncbi:MULTISPECIES: DsbA family oxidoreductase [Bacteroidota]|uniref:DsbA family oxidoreductase n=1 Tax=Bacteroidota TaxID=976 RepID=UPI001CBD7A74|nr:MULTISPECIES: DsbA family oxidoreductase [Bacteroidota]MBZ4190784.1 DsbA family oxidoreductase [Niabella beijingensis]UMQ40826.1 DsbA family oxidoreductase [Chryseobacterium sp. Y16C]